VAACTADGEPTVPCGETVLEDAQRAILARGVQVLAFAEPGSEGRRVTLVRDRCPDATCAGPELEVQSIELERAPDEILLSGTGRHLAWSSGGTLHAVDLECEEPGRSCRSQIALGSRFAAHVFVGTLRSGEWVVLRDAAGLWAVDLAADEPEPLRLGDDPNLLAVALGDRSVVARRILADGQEELVLLRVNPSKHHDEGGAASAGRITPLARGPAFSRVVVTRGPSPAARGELDDPSPDAFTDLHVVATSGHGPPAQTAVFGVIDGEPSDAFPGRALSSHVDREQLEGLDAVSPDGSHLAYVTPGGSLALRGLSSQSSCLVRAASEGRHELAGFTADGLVLFESRQEDPDGRAGTRIGAWDPAALHFWWLSDADAGRTLRAAPPRHASTDQQPTIPWAIAMRDGYEAVQPGDAPQPLGLSTGRVSFLRRFAADGALWLVDAGDEGAGDGSARTHLRLKKIRVLEDGSAPIEFDAHGSDPSYEDQGALVPVDHDFAAGTALCMSAAQPGGFGARCGGGGGKPSFLQAGPEQPAQ
jgi:hypothetical protein